MADKANGVQRSVWDRAGDFVETFCQAAEEACGQDHEWLETLPVQAGLEAVLRRLASDYEQLQAKLEAAERDALEKRASWMKVCEASHYRRLREKFGWDSKFCRARAKAEAERIAYCIDAQRQEGK